MTLDENRLKRRAAMVSIGSNTLLIGMKTVVGIYSGSVSVLSEAAHSSVDLLAAVIAYFAVRTAGKPPDKEHAYGHGKVENLSGAIEALLIVAAAIWIVLEALYKLADPQPINLLTQGIAVMGISSVMNWGVSRYLLKVARATRSHALEADALHLSTDVWTSVGVMSGLAAVYVTDIYWLDPLIAILVAVLIFKAGWAMTRDSMYQLIDAALPGEEIVIIQEILTNHPEVMGYHRLRTRSSGSFRQIDMHVLLRKDMPLHAAHAISDALEQEIEERLGRCDVVIHLEPFRQESL